MRQPREVKPLRGSQPETTEHGTEVAVKLMYGALLQISFVNSIHFFGSLELALRRTRDISEEAIKQMNCNHTKLVAEALGITQRRNGAGVRTLRKSSAAKAKSKGKG